MKTKYLLVSVFLVIFLGCSHATQSIEKRDAIYAPVEASLNHINQKVASLFLITGIPEGFDADQYKKAVEQVCYSTPACKAKSEAIFETYGVDARKVGDAFSVMLCDKEMKWKVMEAFSCNNMRVPIRSWQDENNVRCQFEDDWEQIMQKECSE